MASLSFLGTNNLELFDWDELNFAEISREMALTGRKVQPTINYAPFQEKPPLFSWMQLASYRMFGITPAGARFPNLLCGLVTFLLLRRLGRQVLGGPGHWWAVFLCGSLLPALYFQSGIIDPWFNLFILLGLWPAMAAGKPDWRQTLLAGFCLGLAVLTKGPVALLVAGLCYGALLIVRAEGRPARVIRYGAVGLVGLIPMAVWVAVLWREDDGFFAREFITYQWRLFLREDAGHGGFPGYHVVALLIGCFPAAWVALPALLQRKQFNRPVDVGMRLLFWVVLILFSIVNTKIVHYSSLCYFPLAWFATRTFLTDELSPRWRKFVNGGLAMTWLLYTVAAIAIPVLGNSIPSWSPYIQDASLLARLQLPVTWPWYTFLPAGVGVLALVWMIVSHHRASAHPTSALAPLHRTRASALLIFTPLLLLTALYTIAPRVQQYSQGTPVAFFGSLAGQDVYVGTAYYKSYAHWYYAKITPERYAEGCRERQCRFHEPIGKDLYFASPLRVTEQVLREVPDAELIRSEGGFSFYVRRKNKQ